jgi:L-alanine-DL-glutamate epimerase-like enolase superfamily enzyme
LSIKITEIRISQHQLPLDPPFHPSWSSRPRIRFDATIVRVMTDAGLSGIGSGDYMLGFAGHEHPFIGEDPLRLERHNRAIQHITFHYGRCWPLDLALWDLAGKIAGQPCWKLMGGLTRNVPCYASSGTLREASALADLADRVVKRGFRAMKVRFRRGDWRDDIRALEAVRARVGDRLELMVDCNQGWRFPWDTMSPWTFKDALAIGRELERLGVYWMEEPLHRADRAGMRRLREALDVRIAGGELNREPSELRDVIAEGCLDVVQPDVVSVGGMTGLAKVAHMAAAHNVLFTPHSWGNGIGVIANAHVYAGTTDGGWFEFPWDPPEWTNERRDFMLTRPLDVDAAGHLVLSDMPGLGIELDEAMLRRTEVAGDVIKSNN